MVRSATSSSRLATAIPSRDSPSHGMCSRPDAHPCTTQSKVRGMTDTRAHLIQCFAAVFPDLGEEEIPRASKETTANWDSLANFSLISVIEEEFAIQIAPDDVD